MIERTKWAAALTFVLFASLTAKTPADESPVKLDSLSALTDELAAPVKGDWLIVPADRKSGVYRSGPQEIILTNGLISRRFRLLPNAATVGFDNLLTGSTIIRGVKPEAILELDGSKYAVGGLSGQAEYAYLRPEWIDSLKADPAAFQFIGFEIGQTKERFAWKRKPSLTDLPWPPPGVLLTLHFQPPQEKSPGLAVSVRYEMYDGIPLVCKWLTIQNGGQKPVRLNTFVNEILAAVESETTGPVKPGWEYPNIHVESDYALNGATPLEADVTTRWVVDPQYTTQRWATPALMESRPPLGPDAMIAPGDTFETYRTFELIYDSTERERKGLALRRMCASTLHAGHRGLADSQWTQWKKITELYRWCRGRGVYLAVPDWYFLNGSSKVFLGYCEENWTLPRASQVLLSRQNIFDGTWQKTPSMGWSFLPLVNYKGGGAAALIEPLCEHLDTYDAHLAQNFGSGTQCCYRGSRLYDTDATKAVVKQRVDFYKKYRGILESDIIHVRRPDARDIDCMLHVNSRLKQKGLAMVFNPLDRPVKRMLKLPLYYTGLSDISERSPPPKAVNVILKNEGLCRHSPTHLSTDLSPVADSAISAVLRCLPRSASSRHIPQEQEWRTRCRHGSGSASDLSKATS